jgi:hypothetical protein
MITEDNNQFPYLDIFISHNHHDKRIAEALVDLLRAALNIPAGKIRCTSLDGYGLPGGALTHEQLRQELHDAKLLIGLLTQKSIQSAYVLFELGARWGANGRLIPLLALGADAGVLQGPLSTYTASRCENRAQVQQLITNIGSILNINSCDPATYYKHIEGLIQVSTGIREEEILTINIGLTRRKGRELGIAIYIVLIFLGILYIASFINAALDLWISKAPKYL